MQTPLIDFYYFVIVLWIKRPKKMNAAQFSKTFKGTLRRLKPSTRGTINRGINSGIDEINKYCPSFRERSCFDAIDFLKPEDKRIKIMKRIIVENLLILYLTAFL